MCMCQFATMPNNNSKKLIRSGPELARTWDGVRCVGASISVGKMAVPGGRRRDGSGRWPRAGLYDEFGGRRLLHLKRGRPDIAMIQRSAR